MSHQRGFSVIYEDNHLLVVNKEAGVLVQGDATGDTPLVDLAKEYIKHKYNKPGEVFLGVVHRLDRPVSGIVVLARTSKSLERMNTLFRERETEKIYWAIVSVKPAQPSGTLVHWLLKDESKNKTRAFAQETRGALRSELNYQVIGAHGSHWLLEINPITGRPHQIRVQLATMGCTIYGDMKYGDPNTTNDGSICLHARKLSFVHPVKKEPLIFEAPLPASDLWENFERIV